MSALLTLATSTKPARLTKRWELVSGTPTKQHAGEMAEGFAHKIDAPSPQDLAEVLSQLQQNQALIFGLAPADQCRVVTRDKLPSAAPGTIARTADAFTWNTGPGWLLLDGDPAPGKEPLTRDQWLALLFEAAPALAGAPMVWGVSGSSCIFNSETGEQVTGVRGQRLYVLVADARDIPRAGKALYERLWLAGHGYFVVSKSGRLLNRTPIDLSVWQTNRLDFAAPPVCVPPLEHRRPPPKAINNDAPPLVTADALPDLTQAEAEQLAAMIAAERGCNDLIAEISLARDTWVDERLQTLGEMKPEEQEAARKRLADAVERGRLFGDFELLHSSGGRVTVADLLNDPERWHGERFHDPLEPDYSNRDCRIALAQIKDVDQPYIYSHAHGGQHFTLLRALDRPGRAAQRLAYGITLGICKALQIDPETNPEQVERLGVDAYILHAIVSGCFWSGVKSKVFMLGVEDDLLQFNQDDAGGFITKRFGNYFDAAEVQSMALAFAEKNNIEGSKRDKLIASLCRIPGTAVMKHLKYHNQRDSLEWRVDMFADVTRVEIIEDKVRVILKHKPLFSGIYVPDAKIIADYREYFPKIDDLIELLLAARFAGDRKKAYLWLFAASDWGKGLLLGALAQLGLVVNLSVKEVESIFEGKAVGRSPLDFKRAWVLAIDEFKTVKSELKQLQNVIELSPKFQLVSTVEVFTKLFMSAEKVESLVGDNGVEDQFANRMSIFREHGTIESRPMFVEAGKDNYRNAIAAYVAFKINEGVNKYRAMGRVDATKAADASLCKFHRQYGLDTMYERFSESLPNLVAQFRCWANDKGSPVITTFRGRTYLTSPSKNIGQFIDEEFSPSEAGALRRKKQEIIDLLCIDDKGAISHRIPDPTRAVMIR